MESLNKTARIAGLLYLLVGVTGAFSMLYVHSTLVVSGDAAATANNIQASEGLFRIGIVSGLLCQILFIVLPLVLYGLLSAVDKNQALLMVVLALAGVPIAMLNLLNQFAALRLLSGAGYLAAFEAGQLQAQVMVFLELYKAGVLIAQIFWGLWLFPLGYLVFKSGFLPRLLGVLLIVGCFGYLIDFVAFFLFPGVEATVSQFTFIGELLLPLWLLIKGVNVERWQKRALQAT